MRLGMHVSKLVLSCHALLLEPSSRHCSACGALLVKLVLRFRLQEVLLKFFNVISTLFSLAETTSLVLS